MAQVAALVRGGTEIGSAHAPAPYRDLNDHPRAGAMRAKHTEHAENRFPAERGVLDRCPIAHRRQERDHAALDEQHVIDLPAGFIQNRATREFHKPKFGLQHPEFLWWQSGQEQVRVGFGGQGVSVSHGSASFIILSTARTRWSRQPGVATKCAKITYPEGSGLFPTAQCQVFHPYRNAGLGEGVPLIRICNRWAREPFRVQAAACSIMQVRAARSSVVWAGSISVPPNRGLISKICM